MTVPAPALSDRWQKAVLVLEFRIDTETRDPLHELRRALQVMQEYGVVPLSTNAGVRDVAEAVLACFHAEMQGQGAQEAPEGPCRACGVPREACLEMQGGGHGSPCCQTCNGNLDESHPV